MEKKNIILVALIFLLNISIGYSQEYTERYRPQFHFSPKSGWIGDPDGMIKYDSIYHLFWWGHATSKDLVYWTEQPYPMLGGDNSFVYYSGSVVVDTDNSSGFGTAQDTTMVAVYTMHNRTTNIESQGISYSLDSKYFHYYSGNPVIGSTSTDFRDPQVFRDNDNNNWVMVIARPTEHAIEIYTSDDLKSWTYESTFGPIGAQKEVWEVPDLFQLPINGDSAKKKWVMTCNMGPNKAQYWVGDFDGKTFTIDSLTNSFFDKGNGVNGILFEDFEGNDYGQWTVEGTAFGTKPSIDKLEGIIGHGAAWSGANGDGDTGKLISPEFIIQKKFINFLLSGGIKGESVSLQVVVNGQVVAYRSGNEVEQLRWAGIDVSKWIGQTAHIEIVDDKTNYWGRIAVDQIMFSDVLNDTNLEQAKWIDYGPDFYAVRTYRNYDNDDDRTIWLGWLGNWEYANDIPTTWGGSTGESLPRAILLNLDEKGYEITQHPIRELERLRGSETDVSNKEIDSLTTFSEFKPPRNTYEFEATFQVIPGSNQRFGFNLCKNGNSKLVLGYDEHTSNVFIDRRYCGNVLFNSNFPKLIQAPIVLDSGKVSFHVYVDQLSVEVFVNDGKLVLTSLMFPDTYDTGIELFSENSKTILESFKGWELKSIWGNEPPTGTGLIDNQESGFRIYPNPTNQNLTVQTPNISARHVNIRIFNLLGQEVFYNSMSQFGTERMLDVGNLNKGIYFINVQDGNKVYRQKFLKI